MLERLRVHGFRTLFHTELMFSPLTIMIGKNGVGKTTILDVVQIIGKFARGGASRAFGPPPWSLAWQRTKGIGHITTTDFDLQLTTDSGKKYTYTLKLKEQRSVLQVEEERLIRDLDHSSLAHFDPVSPPASGTILRPDAPGKNAKEIESVSSIVRSFESYELNPSIIERGNDPKITFVGRDGFGVAGFLANLKDTDPSRFRRFEDYIKRFRPETDTVEVWSPSNEIFWGLKDKGQQHPFPAPHLSCGDRQLVGLLCILFSLPPGGTIAIEEIDRGTHPSRYHQIIALLVEAVYEGMFGLKKSQIIITTHSPSFLNKLTDHLADVRLVKKAPNGGTVIHTLMDVVRDKLGTIDSDQSLGEVWEMGLLEEAVHESIS